MSDLLPLFLNLAGRDVVLVGGGNVAASKLRALVDAGARVRVIAPEVRPEIAGAAVEIARRGFRPSDLDGAWLVVAAATPDVNREVAAAAEPRRIFVNAVDDPPNASAFLSGTIRRDGVTIAVSTRGDAPALTALVRQALDALLPAELGAWMDEARRQRVAWRRDGVPMAERKPRLLSALNRLYGTSRPTGSGSRQKESALGHVSLVGAGPGDPGLLTRAAVARLRAADLVLYDALVDDRVLRYARRAQRFFAGKRAGRQAMTQEVIHRVMIRAARRGRRVVRLKGGDPFVFGRGGEEVQALQQAGVSFDVVPGVTSAIAAPALAGIPVTHRGVSTAFLVVSGHNDASLLSGLAATQPDGATIVIVMGAGRTTAIAATLVGRGWAPSTPAAVVTNASSDGQETWRGTLEALAAGRAVFGPGPGTIVVGGVVALATGADEPFERVYGTGR
jgi:uroporphyrin-III C-methyltransferase/precorrin-2 dehydrogenase/sirohydrochlorin ferrochelatase